MIVASPYSSKGMHRPTFAEIDLCAIEHNIRAIRKAVGPNVKIMPAVKADGYGHGSIQSSLAVLRAGADKLGVASVEEAIELRDGGITAPILILGCSSPESAPEIVEFGISATVCDLHFAQALADEAIKRNKKALAHVKVDTGMGRIGVPPEDAFNLVSEIADLSPVSFEGLFTHFPSSDDTDKAFTQEQLRVFKNLLWDLKERKIVPTFAHTANSAAVIEHPDSHLDLVRPGIIAYGLYPSMDISHNLNLRPALTFKTKIVYLKELPAGKTISYGRTFTTTRRTKVATLPVGYADGYDRLLSNRGVVAVNGCKAPVIGRICMDQTMIDVTDVPNVSVGDDVILLGGGYDYLGVDKVAEMLGVIPYEVICSIGKRVPRVYTGSDDT